MDRLTLRKFATALLNAPQSEVKARLQNADLSAIELSIVKAVERSTSTGDFEPVWALVNSAPVLESSEVQDAELLPSADKTSTHLDIPALKQALTEGIFASVATLASQSKHDYARMDTLRRSIVEMESRLFTPENIKGMSQGQLTKLYAVASNNLTSTMAHLRGVTANIAFGAEALSQIEKFEPDVAPKSGMTPEATQALFSVRLKIRQLLEAKSKKSD
jgi:hypothetical protein